MIIPDDLAKKPHYRRPSWQDSAMDVNNLPVSVTDEEMEENLKQSIDTGNFFEIEPNINEQNFNLMLLKRFSKLEKSLFNISIEIAEIRNLLIQLIDERKRIRTQKENNDENVTEYIISLLKNKFRNDIGIQFVQEEIKDIEFLEENDGILHFLIIVKKKKGKLIYQLIESANDLSLIIGKPIMLSIEEK